MTVRNITKTTLSVIILITGFVFFRLYYIAFLSKILTKFSGGKYSSDIIGRLFPSKYIGDYFPALFYFGVMIITAVLLIDAILSQKTAFGVLSPFTLQIYLTIMATVVLCIEKINLLQLWAVFYFFMLICLHSTFKKILPHSEFTGKYADLKLIKGLFLTIKNTISGIISTGIKNFTNPVDEITVLSASTFVLLVEITALISFIVYLVKYWRLIFLSYLIN